ncbi:MAG: protein adenylyltransferase SelO family protein [Bdellovibrio sp.]
MNSDLFKKFHTRFVDRLPGDLETQNFTRTVSGATHSFVLPTPVAAPALVGWSETLAKKLEWPKPEDSKALSILSGNFIPETFKPYAARYGGHQFGHWAGQLGDGRAITIGELDLEDPELGRSLFHLPPLRLPPHQLSSPYHSADLERTEEKAESFSTVDIQLKGAGATPYSRRADGRAVLRSSIREFLCSEAMYFLGVPTTRALSVIASGDPVTRDLFYDGNPKDEPGAIVARVSPSFLRFGSFEILAAEKEFTLLKKLADTLIADHFPELSLTDPDVYGKLLDEVSRRTAVMVAHWLRVGFVHGVMNTDNLSALGLTLDYGPFGFLEAFDPSWTPNTTDLPGRRYCFGRQPQIALWNLSICQEALGAALTEDASCLQSGIEIYHLEFEKSYRKMRAHKLGLEKDHGTRDLELFSTLDQLLQKAQADHCLFYRFLEELDPDLLSRSFLNPQGTKEALRQFLELYRKRLNQEEQSPEKRIDRMQKTNPSRIPRNWQLLELIRKLELDPSSEALSIAMQFWRHPYQALTIEESLRQISSTEHRNLPGASQLSCSS